MKKIIELILFVVILCSPLSFFGQIDSLGRIADSTYVLKNKRIYTIRENGKLKFKAHLKIYEYAIDSVEVLEYLDTLFANKGDTIIIKHSKQYDYDLNGLYSQNISYKAVYKKGPKVKFFVPEIIDKFALHWWYMWVLPLLSFVLVFVILLVCFLYKDKMDGKIFTPFVAGSFGVLFLLMAVSQILMVDFWGVPESIASSLNAHPFIYVTLSGIVWWIVYKIFLRKILSKIFKREV